MWVFIWLMVGLKIPIVALFLIVRWAAREPEEAAPSEDGGIGPYTRPLHPHRPHSRRGGRGPILPRRGPHGDAMPVAPPRVRTVVARGRLVQR